MVVAFALLLNAPQTITAPPPCPHAQPVLCAEFPPSGAALEAWLHDPINPPERWRMQLMWDQLFLVAYGAVYVLGALAVAKLRRAWPVVVIAAVGSGCDAVENLLLLRALELSTIADAHAAAVRMAAQIKFLSLGFASLLGARLAMKADARFATAQAIGGAVALCGAGGFWASQLWQLAGAGIFISLVAIWARSLVSLRAQSG